MACKYFVNGDWVTENQLKELLQGGLLDTLISDGTLAIKGFKVDPDKVIKTDTVITKRQSIPANKLANILAQEIKTRQGYSPNMLSALELKEDGSDFKIPLWASPYASKFESLLTSLVSNKVVKQKFPGGSYVLGSEEGFRIKEGDAATGELKNSGIVFTENFDPEKGLQPMRWDPETKKILPAQIMLPFKFRDEDGNILPLKDFMIEGEDGRMILDTSKLPAKLLNLFGFRIPTQERNSMAAVEIVGFLPETSGDLLLAPRDFTKQMGSDFDVDKLYTYMYNYFYKDGKLQTGFMSDKKKIAASLKIQKEHLEDIKNELKLNKADRKLIDDYIKERIEFNENGDEVVSETATKASELISEILSKESNKELGKALDATFNTISILNRSYKAIRQNNILDIHLQIMTSTNPEIIASIIALDSFGEFEDLARDIDNARNGNKKMPNILSETYQRTKFINATAGKNGVGSFSLDSTFNSTAQGKEIVIQNLTEEAREQLFGTVLNPKPRPTSEEVLAANTPLATFGNVISRGDVSNKYTLRSQEIIKKAKLEKRELTPEETQSLKYKSSIIRALQSTAVDNEKAQILDKLNINDETFDIIRALSILGFEEQEIVGLITQEIIWEYVEKIRNSNSSLTPYNPNAAEDIFAELALKYDPSGTFAALDESRVELLSSKSAEDLMDNIKNKRLMRLQSGTTPDFNLEQLALLRKFQNLTATGKTIKVLQSTINTESSGIPKSLLETQGKIEQIERLPFLNVFNAEKLLGKYEEGKLSTPTTINGYAALYGAVFANEIFDKYFPYKSNGFELAVEEIVSHMPRRAELSTTKKAELQSEIFDAVKSYLYANSNTNLFGENPDVERRRLFIDSKQTATKPKNDSLATILQTLSEGANSKSWYQKNGFLNKLSFNLNKNGTISRINFEAAAGENFDETNIYDGFSYLLSKNFAVGNFNGIDYTSRMLAQELVAAAFLEGGTQGAKQYLKYVPVAYLKSLGFGEYLQGVPFDFQATFFGTLGENGLIYNRPSNFTRQYFQNNPEVTKTVRLSDLKGNIVATPEGYFTLNEDALSSNFVDSTNPVTGDATKEQTQFLSIYDSKLPTKYALYEFDSVERIYRRIPVLNGSFDFVSYNSESKNSLPIEAKEIITTPVPQQTAPGYSIPNIPVQPSKEFNVDVVNNTALPRTTADLPIDRNLANSKEALDDLLNILETADEVSTLNRQLLQLIRGLELPENFKVTYNKTESKGFYDSTKDKETLNINLGHIKNQEINALATTVAHELIHALTSASIKAYQSGNSQGLSARTIAAIQQLENLQKLYIDQLVAKEGEEGLKKFKELYSNWKEGKTSIPAFSKEDISKYYAAIKLTEFVTMALTDTAFQEHLNSITDKSGVSLWEQLKELIANLLNTLGLDIKPGSALASAVKDTMDLIQANQETIRENNIETREFLEFGATYRFQVDGNGRVVKAEYAQGGGMFKSMNAKTQQAKYDDLKNKPNTQGGPTIQPSTSVKEGVQEIFNSNPELAKLGTPTQYSQYLDTVFPNSKVKEIVYHGTAAEQKIEKLRTQNGRIYFSDSATASQYASWDQDNRQQFEPGAPTKLQVIPVIINLQNPVLLDNVSFKETETNKEGDGIIGTNIIDPLGGKENQIVVRDASQAIALGSKEDIEGFKEFISTQPATQTSAQKIEDKLNLEIENINKKYELFPGVFANAGQTEALDKMTDFLASQDKAFLLKGRGGTGKTTIVKMIIDKSNIPHGQILGATIADEARGILANNLPTTVKTKTIASALGLVSDFNSRTGEIYFRERNAQEQKEFDAKGKSDPIENAKLIIIDEASMVGDDIYEILMRKKSPFAKVIFMGDNAQIPPIMADGSSKDSPVFELLEGTENFSELTQRMRQGEESPILPVTDVYAENIESMQRADQGKENPLTKRTSNFDLNSNSGVIFTDNRQEIVDSFVEDFQKDPDNLKNAVIIGARNEVVDNFGQLVRNKLFDNPSEPFVIGDIIRVNSPFLQGKEVLYANGFKGKVIKVEPLGINSLVNLETFAITVEYDSVDISGKTVRKTARMTTIDPENKKALKSMLQALAVKAKSKQIPWQVYYNIKESIVDLGYNYAMTSHKVQGSTYKNVYVLEDDIMSFPGGRLQRNRMLYTAVSRPTTKLVLFSTKNTSATVQKSTGLDLSKLSGSITDYQSIPTSNYGEESDRMSNRPSDDDWEAYNRAMNTNELLPDSAINSEEFRNYLLICGK